MPINSVGAASSSAFVITPDDFEDLPYPIKGIYIGIEGNLNAVFQDDSDAVVLKGLVRGNVYPFQLKKVLRINTTAKDLIGLR